METIIFKGNQYPIYQSNGFAARFTFPFALEYCKGVGLDIGCGKSDWMLKGENTECIPVDISLNNGFDANNLPETDTPFDFIFSSHCLEHLSNWPQTLDYWIRSVKIGGVIYLYLPDFSQVYWRPWHNKKHLHAFTSEIVSQFFIDHDCSELLALSGVDLNNSFTVVAKRVK